ncbi:hypothetical protein SAMN05660831_00817 [Thiohalospira halophila DSM 15071]|uniref:S-adenosyl-l-methionine hydroxide adenosyltransferase n=1 Tax=Thiohalospira halophila DSM 15071 TaxID=1123397 RepID=A0A1I1Q744_9GAMM|nr:SAM-dependent chlorinase/fluorinase [Thiohalospira halophila]SFD13930.1 hypothetical protein SAMN05660831_00817 [Thiohalospira halophila DSM 15071]
MLVLVTDFGLAGPYTGQMEVVLHQEAPGIPQVDLLADAPVFDPRSTSYLLAAYADSFPLDSVFLVVVDPGVGTHRPAVVLRADGRWFVGPDNGVLVMVARRARTVHWWRIDWRPPGLSASFHGRDLFAPVAAALTRGDMRGLVDIPKPAMAGADWDEELKAVVYIDHYGNAITGMRARAIPDGVALRAGGTRVETARVFADVPAGRPLWYENSNGLAEIAVNQGRADEALGLAPGSAVTPIVGDNTLS